MNSKKEIRTAFRDAVFKRDGYKCRMCGHKPQPEEWDNSTPPLDAHHITDRTLMPNGGYVEKNGISLCGMCHLHAEAYHITGTAHPGYSPKDLYDQIYSCHHDAFSDSVRLDPTGWPIDWHMTLHSVMQHAHDIRVELGGMVDGLHEITPAIWELACERVGEPIVSPNIALYGKGIYSTCR